MTKSAKPKITLADLEGAQKDAAEKIKAIPVIEGIRIVSENGLSAYDMDALLGYMAGRGLLDRWNNWSNGNTCAILEGRVGVYFWDVSSFLAGHPNMD